MARAGRARGFRGRGVRFGIPRQAAFFSGREAELAAIERAFASSQRTVLTHAVAGLGGVGKTQLAVRDLHEHLGDFEVVAWIRCQDGGIADLAALAGELAAADPELGPAEN